MIVCLLYLCVYQAAVGGIISFSIKTKTRPTVGIQPRSNITFLWLYVTKKSSASQTAELPLEKNWGAGHIAATWQTSDNKANIFIVYHICNELNCNTDINGAFKMGRATQLIPMYYRQLLASTLSSRRSYGYVPCDRQQHNIDLLT